MQNIQDHIQQLLKDALVQLRLEVPEKIHLEHPANPEHGEWSSNIAMLGFRFQASGFGNRKDERAEEQEDGKTGKQEEERNKNQGSRINGNKNSFDERFKIQNSRFKNPRELAQAIVDVILQNIHDSRFKIQNIQVAGPGFINFYVSNEFYIAEMGKIIEKRGDVIEKKNVGKKVTTEFTDPNPFKEFHIGHLYSNTVGETISRLIEATGADVRRVCYQGDVGMHVAKSLWGMKQKMMEGHLSIADLEKKDIKERVKFLGQAYALGATAYEEDEASKEQMRKLNKQVFAKDPEVMELYTMGRQWSLEYFESIYQVLGTKFEGYYFESEVGKTGFQIVQQFLKKGVFVESNGAIIFPGKKYGLHDRVFINSLGLPTYEAKELGLAPAKYQDWAYDQSIIITGNEIKEYFKVLLKAISFTHPDLAEKTTHLTHGMVRLPEGKMSSRTGKILTGEWLLDEARQLISTILEENRKDMSEEKRLYISQTLSVAAVKYALLKNSIGGDIKFNFSESVSFEGNSGPYLEYTYARARSVLRKLPTYQARLKRSLDVLPSKEGREINAEELVVLRQLSRFGEIVENAAHEFAPHVLCTYLFDLAQAFNSFYAKHSILGDSSQESDVSLVGDTIAFRLQLTEAVAIVIQKGLNILGIETVEEM